MTNETNTQGKTTQSILVVEDNPKHLADARAEMDRRISAGANIGATYATNYQEAMGYLGRGGITAVISDIFFPSNSPDDASLRQQLYGLLENQIKSTADFFINHGDSARGERVMESAQAWKNGGSDAPLGILVSKRGYESKIPVVLCTAGHHHGAKYEPLRKVATTYGSRIIDSYSEDYEQESQSKPWSKALDALMESLK